MTGDNCSSWTAGPRSEEGTTSTETVRRKIRRKKRRCARRVRRDSSSSSSSCDQVKVIFKRLHVRSASSGAQQTLRSSGEESSSAENVSTMTRERGRPRLRRDYDSSVVSSDGSSEAPRNRVRHASTQTTEGMTQEVCSSDQIGVASASQDAGEAGTSPPQACDILTAECPSTSSETVVANIDGNSAKCPICLVVFSADEVATPDTCDHFFCVGCLEEWSSKVNTCPLDREEYKVILARHYPDGELIRRIPLPPRILASDLDDILLPDFLICAICLQHDVEGAAFRSFDCDHSYHIQCLTSFMGSTPINEWFCSICAPAANFGLLWARQRDN